LYRFRYLILCFIIYLLVDFKCLEFEYDARIEINCTAPYFAKNYYSKQVVISTSTIYMNIHEYIHIHDETILITDEYE
jgi:hypothetical protein